MSLRIHRRGARFALDLVLALLVALCAGAAASAAPHTPPLPKVAGPIPVSADSPIYGAEDTPGATSSVKLKEHGYVEEEFFLSGKANTYRYDENWNRQLKQAEVGYTTRLVVRRPRDPSSFSGNVQFECAHPSLGHTSHWDAVKRYVVRHHDIYVSLLCGADALQRKTANSAAPTAAHDILKWFDPQRYAAIVWPGDDGVRWDVIAQAGALLKSKDPANPLAGYRVERTYAAGWSFTGSLWRTYVNEGFHEEYRMPEGSPIFDGYLQGISSSSVGGGYNPLSDDNVLPLGNPRRVTRTVDVPVIELFSENEAITNLGPQAPDSDDPASRHRLYEVPARTHSAGPLPGTTGAMMQLRARGHAAAQAVAEGRCAPVGSDVPMGGIVIATMANMDAWVRQGTPPPHAARMKVDLQTKTGVKDRYGNSEGGVRSAQLDVPLAKYGDYVDPACSPAAPVAANPFHFLRVWRVPLSRAELRALYKDEADYLQRFKARLERMVADRWLLQPEADEQLEAAKANAKAAFAEP